MIIIILATLLVIAGLSLYVIGTEKRKGEFKFNLSNKWQDAGLALTVTGYSIVIVLGLVLLCTKIPAEKTYQDYVEQRAAIVACIEAGETGSEIHSEVTEFNSAIRTHKEFRNNPFIGLFTNKKIAENIEYIDIEPVFDIENYKPIEKPTE